MSTPNQPRRPGGHVRPTDHMPPAGQSRPTDFQPIHGEAPQVLIESIQVGTIIGGQYEIRGRLNQRSGEAELFTCVCQLDGREAILKLYYPKHDPKPEVLEQMRMISHPDVVELITTGKHGNRFYEVMEYCRGGSLAEVDALNETQITTLLPQIIGGLQYLHTLSQPILHLDIKPSNILFRDEQRTDLVLADFGISRVTRADQSRHHLSNMVGTHDYTAPERINMGHATAKSDYYSVGVTLVHLLLGRSPFEGKADHQIRWAHNRNECPIPDSCSARFKTLLKGMLRTNPRARWGFKQVTAWLNHKPILTDDGRPDREPLDATGAAGRKIYPHYQAIGTPHEMATRLHEFDAEAHLFDGWIARWAQHFGPDLERDIMLLEKHYSTRRSLGVFRLRYVLDPSLPLDVAGRSAQDLLELAAMLKLDASGVTKQLESMLYGEQLESWIELSTASRDDPRAGELRHAIARIRTSMKDRSLGLLSLLYTVDPRHPFVIGDRASISSLADIEPLLAKKPELLERLIELLYSGRMKAWLLAAFRDEADARVVERVCREYSDKRLGVYALRWHYNASVPLPFDGKLYGSPEQLVKAIYTDERTFRLGVELLTTGWLRAWLLETGAIKDARQLDALIRSSATDESKLQAVLQFMAKNLKGPRPACNLRSIQFGSISIESERRVTVQISNAGRGHLSGVVTLKAPAGSGIDLLDDQNLNIEGAPVSITVRARGAGLPVGSSHTAHLLVNSNGGQLEIPIYLRVVAPLTRMLLRSLLAGLLLGGIAAAIRYCLSLSQPGVASHTVDSIPFNIAFENPPHVFLPFGIATVAGLFTGVYWLFATYRASLRRQP